MVGMFCYKVGTATEPEMQRTIGTQKPFIYARVLRI
jgi:hypothetical protein